MPNLRPLLRPRRAPQASCQTTYVLPRACRIVRRLTKGLRYWREAISLPLRRGICAEVRLQLPVFSTRLTEPSDVLARHLRRCEVGQCNRESLKTPSKARRVRAQRACHQCARAKSKCDFQHPCARCQRRSTDCVYNWERQHETYGLYGPIDSALPAAVSIVGSASSIGSSHPDATEDEYTEISAPSFAKVNDMSCGQLNKGSYWSDESKRHLQAANAALTIDAEVHYSSLLLDPQSTLGFDKESVSVDFDFTGLQDCTSELNAISPNRDMAEPFESVAHPVTQIGTMKGGSLPKTCLLDLTTYSYLGAEQQGPCQQIPQTAPWLGYSLKQTDPVAVKCREISHLLKDPHPLLTERMITEYITRDALLHSCQLYGRYFHRHYPLLHAPTFEVIETPPILLLAVMIAGSCFRGGPIPAVHIPKFAMRLLGLIQNEPVCLLPLFTEQQIIINKIAARSRDGDTTAFDSTS